MTQGKSELIQIPLNPPFAKGDFTISPLFKGGLGGISTRSRFTIK